MLLVAYSNHAQLQFLDKETKEPVSNVKIFNINGEILDISNSEGVIQPIKYNLSEDDTINIFHSNYHIQDLPYKDLLVEEIFLLVPSYIENLDQVMITAKKPRFLKITGYYLSYQLIDNKAQSFSDGIIEYYIDLKKTKVKDYSITYSRLFKDKKYLKELKKEKPKAINMLGSNIQPFRFEEEILINEWKDKEIEFEEILDEDWVGNMNTNKDDSNFTIEYYTPDNPRIVSFLGLKTVISNHLIREKFYSSKPKIQNLESITKYYKSEMEKKGDEINYELEQDFFVKKIQYLNKEEYKSATDKLNHDVGTNFSSTYWEDYQNFVPPSIQNKLYNDLELIGGQD